MKKIFTLLCTLAFAGTMSAQSWVNYAADSYAGGTGTYDDPYLISTPEQLAKLAKDCDNGEDFFDAMNLENQYFKMTDDIDLDGRDWEPIGGFRGLGGMAAFRGSFDGDGHSILNMRVNKSGVPFQSGLFNNIGDYGEVKNLTVSGNVVCLANAGGIASVCSGAITNCVNKADVFAEAKEVGSGGAGGICAAVKATEDGSPAIISGCVNYGNVTAGQNNGITAGGIVAKNEGSVVISECANFGNIKASTAQAAGILGYSANGQVGITNSTAVFSIVNCYNRGEISAAEQAGGIVATIISDVANSTIDNCYNAAAINCLDFSYSIYGSNGGLKNTNINYVFNDKTLCNKSFVPDYAPVPTVSGNYTTAEMLAQDFVKQLNSYEESNNVWVMDTEGINDGYPVFVYQNPNAPSAIEIVEGNDVKVYANNGEIFVEGAEGTVSVYAVTGNLLFAGSAEALNNVSLEIGVYIVAVDGVSRKVVVD